MSPQIGMSPGNPTPWRPRSMRCLKVGRARARGQNQKGSQTAKAHQGQLPRDLQNSNARPDSPMEAHALTLSIVFSCTVRMLPELARYAELVLTSDRSVRSKGVVVIVLVIEVVPQKDIWIELLDLVSRR